MDKVTDILAIRKELGGEYHNADQLSMFVMAIAIGYGCGQIAKGLTEIGKGINEIATAAKLGCFQ